MVYCIWGLHARGVGGHCIASSMAFPVGWIGKHFHIWGMVIGEGFNGVLEMYYIVIAPSF